MAYEHQPGDSTHPRDAPDGSKNLYKVNVTRFQLIPANFRILFSSRTRLNTPLL